MKLKQSNNAVTVKLVQKKRGDNHEPKFRPVESDELDKTERRIYKATLDAIEAIPVDTYRRLIRNLMDFETVQDDLIGLLQPETEAIAKAIFEGYVIGARDMAFRLREAVNAELKRLRSDLRLVGANEISKVTIRGMYEPEVWTSPEIPPLSLFDQQPDDMAGKVYARFRASEIISSVTDDVQANIGVIIEEAFTAQQTFATGRTVTGLTPEQTAKRIYGLLQNIGPVSPGDYAEFVAPYTNGLFPKWAKAVENSMNQYANSLKDKGVGDETALDRTKKHGERYGNKLRRSRARMIARTEIAFAQNRGMLDTLIKANSDGVLGATAQKQWLTGPTDVCDVCVPMGGKKVGVRENFNWRGGSGPNPPAHPNCRCFILPVPKLSQPPNYMGTGTDADPFRFMFDSGFSINV